MGGFCFWCFCGLCGCGCLGVGVWVWVFGCGCLGVRGSGMYGCWCETGVCWCLSCGVCSCERVLVYQTAWCCTCTHKYARTRVPTTRTHMTPPHPPHTPSGYTSHPDCGEAASCLSNLPLNVSLSAMGPLLNKNTALMDRTAIIKEGNAYNTARRESIMARPSVRTTSAKKSAHERWFTCDGGGWGVLCVLCVCVVLCV